MSESSKNKHPSGKLSPAILGVDFGKESHSVVARLSKKQLESFMADDALNASTKFSNQILHPSNPAAMFPGGAPAIRTDPKYDERFAPPIYHVDHLQVAQFVSSRHQSVCIVKICSDKESEYDGVILDLYSNYCVTKGTPLVLDRFRHAVDYEVEGIAYKISMEVERNHELTIRLDVGLYITNNCTLMHAKGDGILGLYRAGAKHRIDLRVLGSRHANGFSSHLEHTLDNMMFLLLNHENLGSLAVVANQHMSSMCNQHFMLAQTKDFTMAINAYIPVSRFGTVTPLTPFHSVPTRGPHVWKMTPFQQSSEQRNRGSGLISTEPWPSSQDIYIPQYISASLFNA